MRIALGFAAVLLVAAPLATPAAAKECKDVVTAKARSAAQLSDASRERRARQASIDNWKRRARDTYGWRYSFWRRADEKNVVCGGGTSAKHCTATAKPCKLL
jgi:Ni/Co efflux regulator RcnB